LLQPARSQLRSLLRSQLCSQACRKGCREETLGRQRGSAADIKIHSFHFLPPEEPI
jgi:hypothetical protein